MSKRRSVVHLTSAHPSNDVRIFMKECRSLAEHGFDVTLVVPGTDAGYIDGVRLVLVPIPENRKDRMLNTTRRVYKAALSLDADLYHFHDPELMPVGLLLKLKGKRVVYDVHEELAESIQDKDWIPAIVRPFISFVTAMFEGWASTFYDGIVVTRNSLLKRFRKDKTVLVANYPIPGELHRVGASHFTSRPCVGAYVGLITPQRGIREILAGLSMLPSASQFELQVAGTVPIDLERELSTLPGWHRVRLLGWQTREEVAALLARARFGIIMFLPTANHIRSEPTKIYEYMSAGLPIIASDMPHWRDIVSARGFGFVVNPFDPKAIANAIEYLINHPDEGEAMGRRGTFAIEEELNWGIERAKLVGLYDRILNRVE